MHLSRIKQPQRPSRLVGDAAAIGSRTLLISEQLCESVDLRAGERVLDVPCASGSAALAAARRFCRAVAVDVPVMLERARRRADAEGLEVAFLEGEAEDLPFPDGSFEVVLSAGDAMSNPAREGTVGELLRVCRPGGRIGMVSWTPAGYVGELFAAVGGRPPAPAAVETPILWGTEERLRELLGDAVSRLEITRRTYVWRFRSPEEFAGFFKDRYSPTHKAFEALDEAGKARLWDDLTVLAREHDSEEGLTVAMAAEYLEVVATRS